MYQKTTIVGNLGRDPEMRYLPDGKPVTNFSVAVKSWVSKSAEGAGNQTMWVRVAVWGNQAESCNQYLGKGSLVLVEGTLSFDPATGGPKTWEGKDGNTNASFEINAHNVKFLSSKKEEKKETAQVTDEWGDNVDEEFPY